MKDEDTNVINENEPIGDTGLPNTITYKGLFPNSTKTGLNLP